jgi:protection-of-telomeres protein 1
MSDSESLPTVLPEFKTIEEIQNLPNEDLQKKIIVSVIGFVKDFQPPVPTKGPGMKFCSCLPFFYLS